MDKKQFLDTVKKVLLKWQFSYKSRYYYFDTDEVLIVIGTQRSSFMDSYYINYGFKLKDGELKDKLPKDNECDTFGRFIINGTGAISYELLEQQELETLLNDFINKNINPVIQVGLSKYYEINPRTIAVASQKVRQYLNL